MPSPPAMIRSFTFSTGDLPVQSRATAIRELRERGLVPLEPLPGHGAHVHLTKWSLPGAGILSGVLSGLRQEAGPTTTDGGDDLFFGVNLSGGSVAFQRGREVTLEGGDAVFLSHAGGPFTITRPMPVRFVGLRVPRKTVAPLIAGVDAAAMRVVPRTSNALRLLIGYVRAVTEGQVLRSQEIARLVAAHLHDLIALSVGATPDAALAAHAGGVAAARLQAIKADIAAHFGDDSLTVSAVAARLGVTPRYVHKLFETEGITYTQFVLRQRLDRAYRMLRDSRFAARSISAIAYDAGFGDLSYFNRTFRRHYHATPSDVRSCGGI